MAEQQGEHPVGTTRRSFLGYVAAAGVAFLATAYGLLGLGTVLSPAFKGKKKGEWVPLGPVKSFTPDRPHKVDFALVVKDGWLETTAPKSVWVVTEPDGAITVFNARCTHLGCQVDWKEGNRGPAFYCPCHAGVFSRDGRVLWGPPPRGLDPLEWKTKDGTLWCRYIEFVAGIPERKPT